MDDARYRIREFREDDYPAEARLCNRADPGDPTTAEELRHWDESSAAPPLIRLKFVVEELSGGALVANGGLQQVPFNYHPRKFWTFVQVDPDHRRQGIGQALYERLEREATERAGIRLWGSARAEDPASVRFLERQGFIEQRRVWVSRLEVALADLSALPDRSHALAAQGIRFSTLADEGVDRADVRERVYRLWDTTGQDIPVVGEHTSVPFEQFVRLELESPFLQADAVFLAIRDPEYIGVTLNTRDPGDAHALEVSFTGVMRAYRGRGIAGELKRRAVEYARAHGYRYLKTGNDSLNAPIWAINERLGFARHRTWINAEKALPDKRRDGVVPQGPA